MRKFLFATVIAVAVPATSAVAADLPIHARFACDLGKTIDAIFDPNAVHLVLSDGRTLDLPQTISGSGARYANADELIVFWNKGHTAFITEGDPGTNTFSGCIVVSSKVPDPSWLTFASSEFGFSLRYPPGYTLNGGYVFEGFGPGHDISGVSFTIPNSMTTGTNLANDTRLSVETLPAATSCDAAQFLPDATNARTVTEHGTKYSVASMSDAGAGNFYDTTVYALVDTSPCLAVRYFIHSLNIGNFDPGTVHEFDRNALVGEFDAIRRTLVVGQ